MSAGNNRTVAMQCLIERIVMLHQSHEDEATFKLKLAAAIHQYDDGQLDQLEERVAKLEKRFNGVVLGTQ